MKQLTILFILLLGGFLACHRAKKQDAPLPLVQEPILMYAAG